MCPNGRRLSLPLWHPSLSTAFVCAVWCGPVDRRNGARGLVSHGRPCPGACSLRAVVGPGVCLSVWVGFGIVDRIDKHACCCRQDVVSTKMSRDGAGWPRIMSDGAVTVVRSVGTVPMGSRADGDSIMEERLTFLEHSPGTMESTGPNGGSRRVVRSTLDPEEGWGCGWTPQTLTTLHFPRPRWRSAAATPR